MAPIGIFDSGVGGLTVARAILDQLPFESITYIGDTARGPYGPRPLAEVRQFSLEIMDRLVDEGVKALVIACNSASAATLRDARERYDVPVIWLHGGGSAGDVHHVARVLPTHRAGAGRRDAGTAQQAAQ